MPHAVAFSQGILVIHGTTKQNSKKSCRKTCKRIIQKSYSYFILTVCSVKLYEPHQFKLHWKVWEQFYIYRIYFMLYQHCAAFNNSHHQNLYEMKLMYGIAICARWRNRSENEFYPVSSPCLPVRALCQSSTYFLI